jgi:SAM-dependent methyltransferase
MIKLKGVNQYKRDLQLGKEVRSYWDKHIHDLDITRHPIGTFEFFCELDEYRFEKLKYLPELVNFEAYRGQKILEVGCGVGVDLVRFVRGGAIACGVDFSATALQLAQKNLECHHLSADLSYMDGEKIGFENDTFDMVYAHGVLQYTPDPSAMVAEIHRVLRPGCQAIFMMYNKNSWLNLISSILKGGLEHDDAPVFAKISQAEFKKLLQDYVNVSIFPERFPVKTRLHHGWKGRFYNQIFVPVFNWFPNSWVRPFGWHLMAFASKSQLKNDKRKFHAT